jgi:hypothetical protein
MKNSLLLIIMLFLNINLVGQVRDFNDVPRYIFEQLNKIGVDDSPLLNCYESAYLNAIFKDSLKGFDFTGKTIEFIRNGGKGKVHYFDMQKKHIIDKNYPCDNGILYIFNAVQKEESGGYDAAIVYWRKKELSIKEIIKILKYKQ